MSQPSSRLRNLFALFVLSLLWAMAPQLPALTQAEEPASSEVASQKAEADRLLQRGIQQYRTSQFRAALQSWEAALKLYRELGNRAGEGNSLNYLGLVYESLGEYKKAIEFHQQSLAIKREIGNRTGESHSLNNLGLVYESLGQYKKAIEFHQQSLAIKRELGNRAGEGNSLNNLGLVYESLGQYEKAIEFYQQSLAIVREVGNRAWEGNALGNLGNIHNALEEYEKAIEFYQQSLAIAREIRNRAGEGNALGNLGLVYNSLGEYEKAIEFHQQSLAIKREIGDRTGEGNSLNNLGLVYNSLGEYEKAIEFHQQSLAIAREIGDRAGEGKSLSNLGEVFDELNQLVQAEKALLDSIKVWESLRENVGDNDANKISIFDTQANTYRHLQQVLIAQNKTNAALEIAERGRARAFVELLSQRLSPEQSDTAPQPPTSEQIKQIAQEQNATLVEYSIITDELDIDGKKQTRQSQLYIWVVKPTGEVSFRTADLTELAKKGESLNNLVTKSRNYIGARGRSLVTVKPAPDADNINRLRQLHQLLIEPIADLLPADPEEKIIFLPQGPLFLVPFPALQDKDNNYLIENHTILTAPAIQVLQLTREQRKGMGSRESGVGEVLIVGNPTMPSIAVEIGEMPTKLKQLPGAEREAKDIAQLLGSEPLIGARATREAVLERMSGAKIIHLATHGLLDDFKGQGVPGAIALAPDGTGERNDGLLTSNEILDLNLSAELVVLSACDTGRGEITGDGVIGLSRSLVLAGVPSIVVSLWAVDDYSTAFLMSEFYRNWQQTGDKAQSLRQAMLAAIEGNYPAPEHWAAFTLIGESE